MICNKFMELDNRERTEFTGKLLHAAMNDDNLFDFANQMIDLAHVKGLFENVIINPLPEQNALNEEIYSKK